MWQFFSNGYIFYYCEECWQDLLKLVTFANTDKFYHLLNVISPWGSWLFKFTPMMDLSVEIAIIWLWLVVTLYTPCVYWKLCNLCDWVICVCYVCVYLGNFVWDNESVLILYILHFSHLFSFFHGCLLRFGHKFLSWLIYPSPLHGIHTVLFFNINGYTHSKWERKKSRKGNAPLWGWRMKGKMGNRKRNQ